MKKKTKASSLIKDSEKFAIVCGTGYHKNFASALAELYLLNKYGQQQDYFWRNYSEEYTKFIKIMFKLCKNFDKNKVAWFLYKEPTTAFDKSLGLIIYSLRGYRYDRPEFTIHELIQIYKNRFRPSSNVEINNPTIKKITQNKSTIDFLGDI